MQENRNGSKKRNMTLRQAQTGKLEYRNITATYKTKCGAKNNLFKVKQKKLTTVIGFVRCCYIVVLVLSFLSLTKGRIALFRPETSVANFLNLMVLFYKVINNHDVTLFWLEIIFTSFVHLGVIPDVIKNIIKVFFFLWFIQLL